MKLILRLLKHLSDGKFHSGNDLGDILGVTRAAVWKALQQLPAMGLTLEVAKGKGYRLAKTLDLLDVESIRNQLKHQNAKQVIALEIYNSIDSTNTYLLQKEIFNDEGLHVCFAEEQTAGRGRRGRTWQSPYGHNIYLSMLRFCAAHPSVFAGLSLAIGVAVVRALAALGVLGCQLKWPNDVQLGGKKLAGILIELAGDVNGMCRVVIGVGVNVAMNAIVAEAIDQPFTTLTDAGYKITRNELAAELVNQLILALNEYENNGLRAFKDEWQKCDAYLGQYIELKWGNAVRSGIYRGIDDTGLLLLEWEGRLESFSSGEVSLVKKT